MESVWVEPAVPGSGGLTPWPWGSGWACGWNGSEFPSEAEKPPKLGGGATFSCLPACLPAWAGALGASQAAWWARLMPITPAGRRLLDGCS